MKKYILLFLTISGSFFAGAQQQLPNPSFENWTTNTGLPYDEPDTWFGTSVICHMVYSQPTVCDPSTIKTTDAHAGAYAAKLVNLAHPEDGSISEGQLIYSYGSDGYAGFTGKPATLTGYYKFNKTGSDIINIIVTIVGQTSTDIVAFGTLDLTSSQPDYTIFSVPIEYYSSSAPKDIYVMISFNDDASVNSNFTVDNLVFTYTSTPTLAATPVSADIKFFPNPGKEMIHFEKPVKNISIQSAAGSSVLTYTGDTDELNISSLNIGIYIISYEYNGMLIHDKLIVE